MVRDLQPEKEGPAQKKKEHGEVVLGIGERKGRDFEKRNPRKIDLAQLQRLLQGRQAALGQIEDRQKFLDDPSGELRRIGVQSGLRRDAELFNRIHEPQGLFIESERVQKMRLLFDEIFDCVH